MFHQNLLDAKDPNFDPVEARIQEWTDPNDPLKDGGRFANLSHDEQRAEVKLKLEREKGYRLYKLLENGLNKSDSFSFMGNGKTYVVRSDPKSKGWHPTPIEISTGSSSFVLRATGDIILTGDHDLQEVDPEAYKRLVAELRALLEVDQKENEEESEAGKMKQEAEATREVLSDFLGQ